MKSSIRMSTVAAAALLAGAAHAGPFILAGTDADDHGSFSAGANQAGWLFMQRALENLAPGVTNTNMVVYSLGSTNSGSSTDAFDAALSAFSNSALVGLGWTFQSIDGAANIAAFLQAGAAGAGIIMLDSGSNVTGGLTVDERTALSTNASFLNTFVGGGGGLFSQANGYGWLSALVPTLGVANDQETGLTLTAAGNAAFPGLTDGNLSAGPYHQIFTNVGSIPVLATGIGSFTGYNVIIGSSGGSITDPTPVGAIPEPSTYALMLGGLGIVAFVARRRRPLG